MSVAAGSDNQNGETRQARLRINERDFELMDSLYKAAVEGDVYRFKPHANILDQILTPNENTILHIHITARAQTEKPNSLWNWKISTFKKKPSLSEDGNFVRDILEMCPGLLHKANTKGETLLLIAARHGHADVVQDLIAECKRPHQNDPEKGVEATRLMLGNTNEAKDTALHEAVRYNHVDAVKVLTEEDPELSYDANNTGETPLYLAAERGFKDVMNGILLTCKSPAENGPMGRTALHAVAFRRDAEMTKMVLESKGIDLTSKPDQQGWLPLHLAAYLGHYYVVKELLKADKSAAYKADNEGKIPLHLAASKGRVYTMEELILNCPSCCELVDNKGRNVFHFALDSKSKRAVQLLLKNPSLGNLINEKNDDGNTPLLQHAASGTFVKSFVCHPRVDTLAFNHQNNNAIDTIISDRKLVEFQELRFLRSLCRGNRCTRHIDHRGGERKDEGNNIEGQKNNDSKEKNSPRDNEYDEYVKKERNPHLVVAALIATVTFTAGITMPGGYINEKGPDQGAAVLTRSKAFQAFVIFNTVAMIFSTSAVSIHLYLSLIENKYRAFVLWELSLTLVVFALFAMVLAFLTGTYSVLCSSKALIIVVFVIAGFFFLIDDQFGALWDLLELVQRLIRMMKRTLKKRYQGIFFRRFQ